MQSKVEPVEPIGHAGRQAPILELIRQTGCALDPADGCVVQELRLILDRSQTVGPITMTQLRHESYDHKRTEV